MNDDTFVTEKEEEVLNSYLLFRELFNNLKQETNLSVAELVGIMMSVSAIETRDEGWAPEEFHQLLDEVKVVDWRKKPKLTVVK